MPYFEANDGRFIGARPADGRARGAAVNLSGEGVEVPACFVRLAHGGAGRLPGAGDVHVWDATVAELRPLRAQLERSLSAVERRRADRFRFAEDREAFTIRRGLLRVLVGAYMDMEPAAIALDETCVLCGGSHGKPKLPGRPEFEFSLSHSAGRVLCAFAVGAELGVDIERVDAQTDWSGPAQLTLSARERAPLDALPAAARARRFYALWTRKEALAKATGHGLALPLVEIEIGPDDSLRALPALAGRPDDWVLRDLDVGERFAAALALHAPTARVLRMSAHDDGGVP